MWKQIRRNYRRLIAFMLTVAMVATNVGGNLGTVFAAGESENALFLVDGGELRRAIREAEEQGEVFKLSSLRLAAARKSIKNKYEKLLGTEEGKVYELDLEIDHSYAPEGTDVQVFYNAGTQDVIFLFQNESEMVVDYRVNIDGYETEEVTVNPNTKNIEDEEEAAFAENYEASDMINDVKEKPKAEVVDSKETTAAEESVEAEPTESETGVDVTEESGEPEEGTDVSEESSAAGESEETTAQPEEGEELKSEEEREAERETEAEVKEAEEEPEVGETEAEAEENKAEPEADGADGELLSVSRHEAAVVSVSLGELEDEDEALIEEESQEEETEEETEAETEEETEEETAESESEPEEETEESQEEETEALESSASEETGETGETEESQEEAPDASEGIAGNPEEPEVPDSEIEEETKAGDTADRIEMEGQALEDDTIEFLGELKGKTFDTVTILDNINAKALKIAWKDIEEIIGADSETEYWVDYQVNFPDAASIEGVDYVAAGDDLYFAVEPESGYEIVRVTVNGEDLDEMEDTVDLASASNWKGYPHLYVVEEVAEDLMVEVELEELAPIIAAAVYTAETDDAVFSVNVPNGVFEEAVDLQVAKITEEEVVKKLTDQAKDALKEGQVVAGVLAYDIAFISQESGNEVEPAEAVEVSIRYKTAMLPEEVDQKNVTGISVVHLPENEDAEVVASVKGIEEAESELVFRANSLSPFIVVFGAQGSFAVGDKECSSWTEAMNAITGAGDETIRLLEDVDAIYFQTGSAGKSFTLDLSGHKLCGNASYATLYVQSGVVTIIDSSEEKTGIISHISREGNETNGSGVCIYPGATVNMEGGTICGNKAERGAGVYVYSNGVFNMSGGSIEDNVSTSYGGGIYIANGAMFTMSQGVIRNNVNTVYYGGGVYNAGIFTMSGGSIENNKADNRSYSRGGGVYNAGTFTMTGGGIENNSIKVSDYDSSKYGHGGGVYVEANAIFKMEGGAVKNNAGAYFGGGVYNGGTFAMSGDIIENNTSDCYGGGVYNRGTFTMNGGNIESNKTDSIYYGRGGGVYNIGTFTMTRGSIEKNSVKESQYNSFQYGNGGGIYHAGGSLNMTGTDDVSLSVWVGENTNGGIFVLGGDTHLENMLIRGNDGNQSALYIAGSGKFAAVGCTISDNKVGNNIISIYGNSANTVRTFDDCIISNNESTGTSFSNGNIINLEQNANVSFTNGQITGNYSEADGGAGTVSCAQATLHMADTQITGNKSQGIGGTGGIRQRNSQGKINLENTIITGNAATGSNTSCGGVCVTTGDFVLESGAVYNNTSYSEMGDFRFSNSATWKLMKASNMQDGALVSKDYFKEHNYQWLGGISQGTERYPFANEIASTDNDIKELKGSSDLFLQAVPTEKVEGIYLSGDEGDDGNDGQSSEQAVKTFEKALEILEAYNKGKPDEEKRTVIYVSGTVTIEKDTT